MRLMHLILSAILFATPAAAEPWRGHDNHMPPRDMGWNRPGGPAWGYHGGNHGDRAVGNFLGGIVGGYLWNQMTQPAAPPPPPEPAPIPDATTAPWTPAWYDYCANRYHTFDPHTGYYNGLDGQKHFCS